MKELQSRRAWLTLGGSWMLGACASGVWPLQSASGLPDSEAAWLLASLGYRWGPSALRFALQFSPVGEANRLGELVSSKSDPFAAKPDLDVEGASVRVLAMKLVPGRYRATRLSTHPFVYKDESLQALNLEFDARAGQVTYLGEIIAWQASATPLPFGLSMPNTYVATVRDQLERDIALARRTGLLRTAMATSKATWLVGSVETPAWVPVGIRRAMPA